MKISYFGDCYTHTYAAARRFCDSLKLTGELIGFGDVGSVIKAVSSGECDMGVSPIENSVEGTVTATVDALRELNVFIACECVMPIEHNLIALPGVELQQIKTVYSHPQALAQCRNHVSSLLPQAVAVPVAYTSAGLDRLDKTSAAIARAPKEGQRIMCEHFEDSGENSTRFVALSRQERRSSGNKVSVSFATLNNPGALLTVLQEFRDRNLNMTKIESRPAKKLIGQYVFNVDFIFGGDENELGVLLKELNKVSGDLRFLGRYDCL